jgi:hypothetical protein
MEKEDKRPLYQECLTVGDRTWFKVTIGRRSSCDRSTRDFYVILDCVLPEHVSGEYVAHKLSFSSPSSARGLLGLSSAALAAWEWLVQHGYGTELEPED